MTRSKQDTIWPFLCILACLFVLSVAAPRALDHAARTRMEARRPLAAINQAAALPEFSMAAPANPSGWADSSSEKPAAMLKIVPIPAYTQTQQRVGNEAAPVEELSDPSIDDVADDDDALPPVQVASTPQSRPVETADNQWRPALPGALVAKAVSGPASTLPLKPAIEVTIINPSPRDDYAPLPAASLPAETMMQLAPAITNPAPPAKEPSASGAPGSQDRQSPAQPSAASPRLASIDRLPRMDRPLSVPRPPVVKTCWQTPLSLRTRLEKLLEDQATAPWAARVQRTLERLGPAVAQGPAAVEVVFDELQALIAQVEPLADRLAASQRATELRRAGHALHRRLELWSQAISAAGPELTPAMALQGDPERLSLCLASLDMMHDDSQEARAWQQFLVLDALSHAAARRDHDQQELSRLARLALARLAAPMNAEQREVVSTAAMDNLAEELRHWAAEPVDLAAVLDGVEHFEQSGLPSCARQSADDCRRLSFSPLLAQREMGERLELLYRNANLRISFTTALLNRLLPAVQPEYEPVRDTILGLPVQGRSLHSDKLSVQFIPDPQRLLMSFNVNGTITADTYSSAGPATFFHDSHAHYVAHKPLEIEAAGIRLDATEVSVVNHMRLRSLRTKFDSIPIFGSLAREVARSQHDQQEAAANRETEEKVSARCRQRIDEQSYTQLDTAVGQMREHLFAPLSDLSLMPTLIAGVTTEDRMAMRLRLAATHQLGSDTPRPRAPGDSLASVQIHETALNNLIEQLDLNGRRMALPELVRYVAAKLHRPATLAIDPAHEDLTIAFAPKDAIYVRCTEDQITVNLAIAELSTGSRSWQNFQVRVAYRPEAHGRSAELVRDGVVQLIGRLSTGSQIALRGIFSKAFPRDGTYPLTPAWLLDDPRLKDLAVTQFVIDDGWIGLALGPNRAAQTTVKGHKTERKVLGWLKQPKRG